jgi:hypothetical protein
MVTVQDAGGEIWCCGAGIQEILWMAESLRLHHRRGAASWPELETPGLSSKWSSLSRGTYAMWPQQEWNQSKASSQLNTFVILYSEALIHSVHAGQCVYMLQGQVPFRQLHISIFVLAAIHVIVYSCVTMADLALVAKARITRVKQHACIWMSLSSVGVPSLQLMHN